jgi:hypothetical protein
MSQPKAPDPVKLISSLFSPDKELIDFVIRELSVIFGQVDWKSGELLFDRTKYYTKEMGWPLHRRFVSFQELITMDKLTDAKIKTNKVEQQHLCDTKRMVNIDPGYISAERLVLATGKNYIHRIYLSEGIYADLTLVYKRGSFSALEWTYPDYADSETIGYFNAVREQYMNQLREMKRID